MKAIPNRQKKNVVPRRDFDRGQWERIQHNIERRERKTKRQPSAVTCSEVAELVQSARKLKTIEDNMTTLTLELPSEVYQRLREEADRLGKAPQIVAQEWIVEQLARLTQGPTSDRGKVRQALYAAGLLAELSPGLRSRLDPTVRPEDVEAALGRASGKWLSEIVLEQRGPKG